MLGPDEAGPYIVEQAVVSLSDYSVDRANPLVAFLRQGISNQPVQTGGDAEGVCQNNRGLDVTQFLYLSHPGELSESVPDIYCSRDFIFENIALMRDDCGHACPNVFPFDAGYMSDGNTWDIGDCVVFSRLENTDGKPQLA